jgi:phage gp36-like protein
MINGYLLGRVTLPLAIVPEDVKLACVDIAVYRMCPNAVALTEQKKERNEMALQWLKDVKSGKVHLNTGGAEAPVIEAPNLVKSPAIEFNQARSSNDLLQYGARELTRDKLQGIL